MWWKTHAHFVFVVWVCLWLWNDTGWGCIIKCQLGEYVFKIVLKQWHVMCTYRSLSSNYETRHSNKKRSRITTSLFYIMSFSTECNNRYALKNVAIGLYCTLCIISKWSLLMPTIHVRIVTKFNNCLKNTYEG